MRLQPVMFLALASSLLLHGQQAQKPTQIHPIPFNGANQNWRTAIAHPAPFIGATAKMGLQADIPSDRLLLGQGYNSATGEPGPQCVAYDPSKDAEETTTATGQTTPTGQSVNYVLKQVTSIESLKQALDVGASASFGWGVFSSDATAHFIQTGEFTQYNNFVLARVTIANPFRMLSARALTDPPALGWAKAGANVFISRCGDQFIYGRQTGGDMTAIIQFSSTSDSDQQQVTASINASLAGFGGGSAEFSNKLQKLTTISSLTVTMLRNGGEGEVPDINSLIAAVSHFPSDVLEHPYLISVASDSYNTTSNLPLGISFNVVEDEARSLALISQWLDQAYAKRSDLNYIFGHQSEFVIASQSDLTNAWKANEKIISSLMSTANSCHDDSSHCQLPDPPDIPSYAPPRTGAAPTPPPVPKPPTCTLQRVGQDGSGKPYLETFTVNFPGVRGTPGSFAPIPVSDSLFLHNPQGIITSVDYTCHDIGNGSCGSLLPRNGTMGTADYKRGDVEILADGTGFNWYRMATYAQGGGIPGSISPGGYPGPSTMTYVAHYSLPQQVCTAQ